jgi:hypothetical protein
MQNEDFGLRRQGMSKKLLTRIQTVPSNNRKSKSGPADENLKSVAGGSGDSVKRYPAHSIRTGF